MSDNDKGVMQNISFNRGNLDLHNYAETLANEKHGGVFSSAIMECIRTHRSKANRSKLIDSLEGFTDEQKEIVKQLFE